MKRAIGQFQWLVFLFARSGTFVNVSVIIPVINEADNIAEVVGNAWQAGADQVIVVDGGSSDATKRITKQLDCQLIECEPGRGVQLDAGARQSTGDVILFLHADARLPISGCQQIRKAIDQGFVGGGFRQQIDNPALVYRLIEFGNRLRARYQKLIYGDQGMFVRRRVYESMGGFEPVPIMEDFIFSSRLKHEGEIDAARRSHSRQRPTLGTARSDSSDPSQLDHRVPLSIRSIPPTIGQPISASRPLTDVGGDCYGSLQCLPKTSLSSVRAPQ